MADNFGGEDGVEDEFDADNFGGEDGVPDVEDDFDAELEDIVNGLGNVEGPADDVAAPDDDVAGPSKRNEPGLDGERAAGPSSKRVKLSDGESDTPTRVLSLRGLPADITEVEVASLGEQFGHVINVILTRNKHKALLEMADQTAAVAMMDKYSKAPMLVRSKEVGVNYSKHDGLKLKVSPDQSVTMDSSRRVLHVIVDNMAFPVSLKTMIEVFSVHGFLSKILTFNHNDTFHVLVQFVEGSAAHKAKLALNGQNIYPGYCKLYIEYSKLQDLVVKYNSDISVDFAKPFDLDKSGNFETVTTHEKVACDGNEAGVRRPLLPLPGPPMPIALTHSTTCMPSQFLAPTTGTAMQFTNPYYAEKQIGSSAATAAPPRSSSVDLPKKVPWSERRPVVLASNLDEGRVTTDALFTLFGVYGDVIRVKICCNTKSKALIQFKDYKFARDAIMNLDGINLWGRQLKLAISKYRIVSMPKEGAHNVDLTRDYTTSRWHRFHNGDRAMAPIVPPSKTLFLANIPPKVTETKLKRLFNSAGTVVDFKFFEPSNLFRLQQAVQIAQLPPNSDRTKDRILASTPDRRMALIEMRTVEESIESLVMLHNKQFPGTNRYLCVSFTKSVIEHRDG